jgi:hypothetical protein
MAKAVRRCYKKVAPGEWKVGKYCNPKNSKTKYASGKPKKKPPLGKQRRVRRPATPVLDFDSPTPFGFIPSKETAVQRNNKRIATQKIKNIIQPPSAPPTMSARLQALVDAQKPVIGPPRPTIIMTRFD